MARKEAKYPRKAEARNLLQRYGSPGVVIVFHLTGGGIASFASAGTSSSDSAVARTIGDRFITELEVMCEEVGIPSPRVLVLNETTYVKKGAAKDASLKKRWGLARTLIGQGLRILFRRKPNHETQGTAADSDEGNGEGSPAGISAEQSGNGKALA